MTHINAPLLIQHDKPSSSNQICNLYLPSPYCTKLFKKDLYYLLLGRKKYIENKFEFEMKIIDIAFNRGEKSFASVLSFTATTEPSPIVLHSNEKALLNKFSSVRKNTFIAGRHCAKQSISKICDIKNLSEICS